jgi:Protein of unknown function (DUF3040)
MSLPTRQQRALDRIEASLVSGDPNLTSMFATFTRMTCLEAMPSTEAIRRRLPRVLIACAMALAMAGVIAIGALMSGPSCARMLGRGGFAHATPVATCRPGAVAGTGGR